METTINTVMFKDETVIVTENVKAELLSFLDDAVYDQNRSFKEQFVEFIKNDEI